MAPAAVRKFDEALDPMGKKIEIETYDDAGHAFENPNGERYRAADAADAWKRNSRLSCHDAEKVMAKDAARSKAQPGGQKPRRERSPGRT